MLRFLILSAVLSANILAGNILQNSSFEAGDLHGWSYSSGTFPVRTPLAWTNDVAFHGGKSARIEQCPNRGTIGDQGLNPNAIMSRVYQLKTNTTYTLSVYALSPVYGSGTQNYFYVYPVQTDEVREGQSHDTFRGAGFTVATTNWTRYSVTFTTTTNLNSCFYDVVIESHWNGVNGGVAGRYFNVDAVQLEEGGSATAYAPIQTVEIGANLVRANEAHVFYTTDTLALDFTAFNIGGTTASRTVNYEIRDLKNNLLTKSSFTVSNIGAGASVTNNVALGVTQLGWFRMTYWIPGVIGSLDDVSFSRVLPPVPLAARTNGIFGAHIPCEPWFLGGAKRVGIHWNRLLSLEREGSWFETEPIEGTLAVDTNRVGLNRTYGIEPMMNIISPETVTNAYSQNLFVPHIPDWATNSDLWPATNKLTYYCTNIATKYINVCDYFEIMNEQVDTNSARYPTTLKVAALALRTANPNVKIVAFANFYAKDNRAVLDQVGVTNADWWSTHMYAYNASGNDVGLIDYLFTNYNAYPSLGLMQSEAGLRTESGTRAQFWEQIFSAATGRYPDNDGVFRDSRYRLVEMAHMFHYVWRDPMKVWFYYDARNVAGFDNYIQFSIFDVDMTMRPQGVMMAATAQMLEGASQKGRVNIGAKLDSFWYLTRSNLAAVLLYATNNDDLPTTLGDEGGSAGTLGVPMLKLASTLATNQFVLRDLFGNVLPYPAGGKPLGLDPIWVEAISGTATNTLLSSLSVSSVADTEAPNVQIITFPLTNYSGDFVFRWNAVDNRDADVRWNGQKGAASYTVNTNAIQYRTKLAPAESGFTAWTNTSWRLVKGITWDANSTFYVDAKDAAGNVTSSTANSSTSTTTPRRSRVWR